MRIKSLATAAVLVSGSLAAQTHDTIFYSGAIVTYTIPSCATNITIEARGARGGTNASSTIAPGNGAIMIGDFVVTPGSQLKVLVGETNNAGNGGGGGTFVTDMSNNPWIVAGGGGGASGGTDSPDKHGNVTTTGGTGAAGGGAGGTAGSGGFVGPSGFQSGAGGGLLTNGADGWTPGTGGQAFVNGGAGANVGFGIGGFGGGGNGSGYVVGGGGGGYSGGGGGGNNSSGVGGGGGSFNAGTNQVNTGGANTGTGMVIFTYNATPVSPASITGTLTVCENDTLTLTAATVAGATSYTWTVSGTATIISGQGTNVITLTDVAGIGTVSVTATSSCGTSGPTTTTYTVNANPVAGISVPSDTVCEGTMVTLTGSGSGTYAWSSGGTGTTEMVTVTAQTTYTLTVDNAGCTDTATQTISTHPDPVVTLGADFSACDSATLDAMNVGSTYMWSDSSATQMIMVTNSGTYSVLVTDANGCTGYDEVAVTINASPVVTGSAAMNFVCTGEPTVQLFGSPAGGTWTGNGVFGSTFEPDTAGVGTHDLVYSYTDSVGCSGVDTISITVDLCLGVAVADDFGFSVYPNPNNGTFSIAFSSSAQNVIVEMLDVNGRSVFAQQYDVNAGDQKQLDLSGEANGIYLVKVTSNGSVLTQRISISK